MKKALIQCAVPPEFEALRQTFKAQKLEHEDGKDFFVSADGAVVCVRGGMGSTTASESLRWAISKWHPRFVFDFGIAGALAPQLVIGDIILANVVLDSSGEQLTVTNKFNTRFKEHPEFDVVCGLRVSLGSMTCENQDIVHNDVRAELYKQTGALAVNWETIALARVCAEKNIEFCSLRMISDCTEDDVRKLRTPEMLRKIRGASDVLATIIG